MKQLHSSKKFLLATLLTTGLSLAISQAAFAQDPAPATPAPPPAKQSAWNCPKMLDPAMKAAHDKFLSETVELRKQMAEKQAAMRALMRADNPDSAKSSQLAGELFDLREKLRLKAQEHGLPMMAGMGGCRHGGMGMGMGCDGMPGKRGGGRGQGWNN